MNDQIAELMKADPSLRLITARHVPRKMFWANDTHQWEVYSSPPDSRGIFFHYKGDSLADALDALKAA